jgi:hypothetical protein
MGMTRTRQLIIAFWVFIIIMLVWQFYTYNQGLSQAAIDHPQQQHFYFFHTNSTATASAPAHVDGPDVIQSHYKVEEGVPSPGNFTCEMTLKNVGNAKAINIQGSVHPYRGTETGDEDAGPNTQHVATLDDSDYRAQISEWLTFPDLAPGESSTQSVSFIDRTEIKPGQNPKPDIVFEPEKTTQTPPRGAGD